MPASIAQGSVSRVGLVTEATWGTTPATPELTALPYTSFNVNLTKSVYEDTSVQADRMSRYSIHGNKQVGGDIATNLSAYNYDLFLESLMNNAFTANVLKTGTTRKSFTVEQGSTDINQYSIYKGVVVDKMTVTVPVDGVVTAGFTVIGKDMTIAGTSIDTNSTFTAPVAVQPFIHAGGTFNIGGVTTSCVLTGITLSVDNGYTTNFSLGNTLACDLSFGMAKVSGTMSIYYKDSTAIQAFIDGTESSLEFGLVDTDGNEMTFLLPNIKYNGASKSISGTGSIVLTIPFVAHYDAVTGTNLRITRDYAV